jgi:hypothetical protein
MTIKCLCLSILTVSVTVWNDTLTCLWYLMTQMTRLMTHSELSTCSLFSEYECFLCVDWLTVISVQMLMTVQRGILKYWLAVASILCGRPALCKLLLSVCGYVLVDSMLVCPDDMLLIMWLCNNTAIRRKWLIQYLSPIQYISNGYWPAM